MTALVRLLHARPCLVLELDALVSVTTIAYIYDLGAEVGNGRQMTPLSLPRTVVQSLQNNVCLIIIAIQEIQQ